MRLDFDPEALQEIRDAAKFYEENRSGLVKAFLTAIEVSVVEINHHPLLWRIISGRFRRYLMPQFPYGLIYTVHKDSIYLVAAMHLKRKPGYWGDRGKEIEGKK